MWNPNDQEANSGEKMLKMSMPLHFFGPNPLSIQGPSQVFDYSRMVGRFFEPDDKICLIFDNVSYDKLRKLPEYAKRHPDISNTYGSLSNQLEYDDMPRAREWADEFEQGIKDFGFSEQQIYRYKDADLLTMQSAIWTGMITLYSNPRSCIIFKDLT